MRPARHRAHAVTTIIALAGWAVATARFSVGVEPTGRALEAGPPCDACPADIDETGTVDVGDLLVLLAAWGGCSDLDCDGFAVEDGDCDDDNALVFPGASEFCDGIDNDCDFIVDEDPVDGTDWWPDADSDGYGDAGAASVFACLPPAGHVDNDLDCDDSDDMIRPGVDEFCDGIDNDCDFIVDEDPVDGTAWWPDLDNDGYGDESASPILACTQPAGFVDNGDDCDDINVDVSPSQVEVCGNGIDDDCNGAVDDGC